MLSTLLLHVFTDTLAQTARLSAVTPPGDKTVPTNALALLQTQQTATTWTAPAPARRTSRAPPAAAARPTRPPWGRTAPAAAARDSPATTAPTPAATPPTAL